MSKHERSFQKAFEEEASSVKQPQLKPFETPKGYVPPTLGEQFRYVRMTVHRRDVLRSDALPCRLAAPTKHPRAAALSRN